MRERVPDERHSGAEEEPVRGVERVGVSVERATGWRPAAVPDEDVEATEAIDRCGDSALEVGVIARVAERLPVAECRVRRLFRPVSLSDSSGSRYRPPPAREEDNVGALLRKRLGAREPEPGRGAADERGAPPQSEIHGRTLT